MKLPTEIYSVASVRNIDRNAINDAGISGYTLMTRAGKVAVQAASSVFPGARHWQVICGSGNNGGDGYVVARVAAELGVEVSVVAASSPQKLSGDAASAYKDFAASGGVLADFDGTLDPGADLLIDGLLGSGLERPLEGKFAELVGAMNAHRAPVVALDIPSGLHGDTGELLGTAVDADLTVTFVGLKSGLFLGSGPDRTGELRFSGLGIPGKCRNGESPVMRRIDDDAVQIACIPRRRGAHKGEFGHVVIVAGGPGMPGAARICGEAALRSGAGLVSVATHPSHSALIPIARPELMCHGIHSADELQPLVAKASVLAIGPGLGTDKWARSLLKVVLASELPIVADADALNMIADGVSRKGDWVLTPHPGEAARLLGSTSAELQSDRLGAVAMLAKRYGGTTVLKGSGTLISAGQGQPWLCSAGNPGMASPGMGDALTGIIASLRAQGLPEEMAAIAGVQIHAKAGDRAAAGGERGLIVSDLLAEIRHGINR